MEKKPARQGSQTLPSRAEPHAPLLPPPDDPSPKGSPKQPLAKEKKRELREHARKVHEDHWLAPAGSEQEKQLLERLTKQEGLSQKDRDLIYKWIDDPDEFAKRNALFWQCAKKSVLGPVVYETAMERHRMLDDKEWLVACFTAQGMKQQEIAKLTHIGVRMVDNIIRSVKKKIAQELHYDSEIDDRVQIVRWFFGL
jgi:hypothetical protein